MISGAHAIIYSTDPDADRAFFRDVLKLPNVDVGDGWARMRGFGRRDVITLEDVLVETRAFVPEAEGDLEAGGDRFALLEVEALVVDPVQRKYETELSSFREEHAVVDEAVDRDEIAQGSGGAEVVCQA